MTDGVELHVSGMLLVYAPHGSVFGIGDVTWAAGAVVCVITAVLCVGTCTWPSGGTDCVFLAGTLVATGL